VVWKLDRLGRSLKHLIETVTGLSDRGVGFQSLQEDIDTTTSGGKLVFHVFGALAEFERDIIRERTLAGLAAARARGRSRGHLPDAGDLEGDALSVSGRTEEPMIDDPIGQEARRVSEPSATVGCPANWTAYGWFLLRCYLTPELPDHWSGPADRPRLHDLTHPLSFPAGAAFGTIAATGPASLADTRRAYQQSMQL